MELWRVIYACGMNNLLMLSLLVMCIARWVLQCNTTWKCSQLVIKYIFFVISFRFSLRQEQKKKMYYVCVIYLSANIHRACLSCKHIRTLFLFITCSFFSFLSFYKYSKWKNHEIYRRYFYRSDRSCNVNCIHLYRLRHTNDALVVIVCKCL